MHSFRRFHNGSSQGRKEPLRQQPRTKHGQNDQFGQNEYYYISVNNKIKLVVSNLKVITLENRLFVIQEMNSYNLKELKFQTFKIQQSR